MRTFNSSEHLLFIDSRAEMAFANGRKNDAVLGNLSRI
ncbi:Protein of unknown function [Anaplasma phagocytophilum]|uniref:Uncharacterized protein n=1 Tax=Anaplasma phagocytophilum TaxID=948 RepID=A0A098EH20_ANAPH|nr:Protein of unknown function [Anaplasma phagocytophilum]